MRRGEQQQNVQCRTISRTNTLAKKVGQNLEFLEVEFLVYSKYRLF